QLHGSLLNIRRVVSRICGALFRGSLGAPILYDRFYPELEEQRPDDPERPLQLFAHTLAFDDPITGEPRRFTATVEPTKST
ncbi:hypothetical protein ABQ153_11705, partial [Xanthomonas sp. WHRI 8356]